jgi:peptide/nickel transport system substrate-binding protein
MIKVVALMDQPPSAAVNYTETLVALDEESNVVPCLAKDWRWLNDRTIEFKLREDVWFHNGEKFNAESVKINWEEYRRMQDPRSFRFTVIADETEVKIIDEFIVRFIFPEPEGVIIPKFQWFLQIAPAFFKDHKFREKNWGYLPEAGPWGTGPFKLVEGGMGFGKARERLVLEAFDGYWDPQYPKLKKVIFENAMARNRNEALRLCTEEEGYVDIINHIRPLDTLKVAESPFAKVLKRKDDTMLYGFFNENKKGSRWNDVRLRKAINYAINREEVLKYGAKGNAFNVEGSFLPPGAYGHNPDLTLYTYDTTKAKSLLAEAGFSEGFEIKLVTHESCELEVKLIKRMLERIGLKVEVEVGTYPEFLQKIYHPMMKKPPEKQDWDIAVYYLYNTYAHNGMIFLAFGLIKDSNISGMKYDPIYERMWKDMAMTVDTDIQEEKMRELVRYIYDNAHLLFIYSPLSLYAVNTEVNYVPQKFCLLRFKETSVTDNHWSVRQEGGR